MCAMGSDIFIANEQFDHHHARDKAGDMRPESDTAHVAGAEDTAEELE